MAPHNSHSSSRSNKRVLGYCAFIGLVAVLYGLDLGETSGFLAMPVCNQNFGFYNPRTGQHALSATQQTTIYGIGLGVALIAAAVSGTIGSRYGRRIGLFLAAFTSIIGPAIQTGVTTYAGLLVGKAIAGLGVGFAANFVIPYWAETTPASLRGSVIVMYQAIINISQFIGQCINEGTHDIPNEWSYRAPLLTELLPPIILIAFLYWVPDTPRYYVSRGRPDKALVAMRKLRGPTWPEAEIVEEVNDIEAFYELERELEGSANWLDCFRGTDRRRTLITVITTVCQELSGIAFISGYGTLFFTLSGIKNPFTVTVISGMCAICGSLLSFVLIKLVGRRPILIGGAATQGVCMFTFAIVGTVDAGSAAAQHCLAAFVSLFLFSYGATWGAVSQVLLGEISSTKMRSKTVALATSAGWVVDLLIICGMPYLLSDDYVNLGPKVGFIFGGCQILTLLYSVFFVPETKDRTLEEIDEMFMNEISAWNFKGYTITKSVHGVAARHDWEEKGQQEIVTTHEFRPEGSNAA